MMTATTTTTTTATKMMYGRSTPSLRRAAAGRSGRTASAGRSRGAGDRLSERRRPLCPPCLRSTWPAPSGWLPCRDGGVVTVSIYRGRTGGGGVNHLCVQGRTASPQPSGPCGSARRCPRPPPSSAAGPLAGAGCAARGARGTSSWGGRGCATQRPSRRRSCLARPPARPPSARLDIATTTKTTRMHRCRLGMNKKAASKYKGVISVRY